MILAWDVRARGGSRFYHDGGDPYFRADAATDGGRDGLEEYEGDEKKRNG